jgi:hypothetical protein
MTKEEKLDKVTKGFLLLSEEKQDYILGILQALAFVNCSGSKETEPIYFDSDKGTGSI